MLSNLQLLRALAAINVVAFHTLAIAVLYGMGTSNFSVLDGWGKSGVDVFFVISGFVMYYAQQKSHKSAYCFIKHRAIRIVPIYWLLTLFIVGLFFLLPSVFNHTPPSLLNVFSSLFFISHPLGENSPVLYVGWTLEYEMLFYAVFAFSILFKRDWLVFWLPVVGFSLLVSLDIVNTIVLEFVFGMLVAKLYLSGRFKQLGALVLLLGVLLMLLTVIFHIDTAFRALFWGVPAALIIFGAVTVRQIKNNVFRYLGDASYSIYLVQVFTIPAFYKFASKFLSFVHGDLLFVLSLTLSVLFGCVFYALVEKPATIFLNNKFGCVK